MTLLWSSNPIPPLLHTHEIKQTLHTKIVPSKSFQNEKQRHIDDLLLKNDFYFTRDRSFIVNEGLRMGKNADSPSQPKEEHVASLNTLKVMEWLEGIEGNVSLHDFNTSEPWTGNPSDFCTFVREITHLNVHKIHSREKIFMYFEGMQRALGFLFQLRQWQQNHSNIVDERMKAYVQEHLEQKESWRVEQENMEYVMISLQDELKRSEDHIRVLEEILAASQSENKILEERLESIGDLERISNRLNDLSRQVERDQRRVRIFNIIEPQSIPEKLTIESNTKEWLSVGGLQSAWETKYSGFITFTLKMSGISSPGILKVRLRVTRGASDDETSGSVPEEYFPSKEGENVSVLSPNSCPIVCGRSSIAYSPGMYSIQVEFLPQYNKLTIDPNYGSFSLVLFQS